MAESVDALVSNTSGATRAGSTPALGTRKGRLNACLFLYPEPGPKIPFFSSPQRTGRPSGTALARILASPQYVISCITGRRETQLKVIYHWRPSSTVVVPSPSNSDMSISSGLPYTKFVSLSSTWGRTLFCCVTGSNGLTGRI